MTFADDIEAAIAEFAKERGLDREQAIEQILRDWLEGNGYVPVDPDVE